MFLLVADYILFKLTGKFVWTIATLSRTILFDIKNLNGLMIWQANWNWISTRCPKPSSGKYIGNVTDTESGWQARQNNLRCGDQQCALGVQYATRRLNTPERVLLFSLT